MTNNLSQEYEALDLVAAKMTRHISFSLSFLILSISLSPWHALSLSLPFLLWGAWILFNFSNLKGFKAIRGDKTASHTLVYQPDYALLEDMVYDFYLCAPAPVTEGWNIEIN